jgi:glycosyltransferase involved in cell wall biosynthesis
VQRGNYAAWVALLRHHKRPDLLIEMARKSPDINYVVCGARTLFRTAEDYSERIVAELRSTPNIEYLAHVEPARCLEIIAGARAFVSWIRRLSKSFLESYRAERQSSTLRVT